MKNGFIAILISLLVLGTGYYAWSQDSSAAGVRLDAMPDGGLRVYLDGSFFAEYRPDCEGTPIIWPICSAQGALMTRNWPMIDDEPIDNEKDPEFKNILKNAKWYLPTEEQDHPHHRSLWFTHGEVSGSNFWMLGKAKISQRDCQILETGDHYITIQTKNDWLAEQDQKPVCTDVRTVTLGTLTSHPAFRYIDFDITITAERDNVTFVDTKEGTLGIRVPGTMDGTATKRNAAWGGNIINSNQQKNDDAWGKHADWVDYSGPIPVRLTDEQLQETKKFEADNVPLTSGGILIMNHPDSFRYPTWWHVRTYGLFAANPFGQKDFESKEKENNVVIQKGKTLTFRYRLVFYDGQISFDTACQLYKNYLEGTR